MVITEKLVRGVGINDAEYKVMIKAELPRVNGKRNRKVIWACPYYTKWKAMIDRTYGYKILQKYPSYIGCSVCYDWLYFSNFKKWVDEQPNKSWQDCDLDKDLLVGGNKIYSPDTVVFITHKVNTFMLNCSKGRGDYMLGTRRHKTSGKFQARGQNPFTGKHVYLGTFDTELDAHKAWQAKKHEYACQLADLQSDPRVAQALRERYAPDKDWTKM